MKRLILALTLFMMLCVPASAQDDCARLRAGGGPVLRAMIEVAQDLHQAAQLLSDTGDPAELQAATIALFNARLAASPTQSAIGPALYREVRTIHELLRDFDPGADSFEDVARKVHEVRDRLHRRVTLCFEHELPITPYTAHWTKETVSLAGCDDAILAVAFGDSGRLLAAGDAEGCMTLWTVSTWQMVERLEHTAGIESLAFSAAGSLLAAGDANGTIRLWDTNGTLRAEWDAHTGGLTGLAFGTRDALVSAGEDGMLRVWAAKSGEALQSTHLNRLTALAVQDEQIAAGDFEGAIWRWNLYSGSLTMQGRHPSSIFSLAFDPSSGVLAAGDFDEVWLWPSDGVPGEPAKQNKRIPLTVSLAFSPDGHVLAVGTASAVMLLLPYAPPNTARAPLNLYGHGEVVTDIAFSPDGRLLASAGGDGRVRVWRVPPLAQLITQTELICTLTAPDYVNVREGPGTNSEAVRMLQPAARMLADAQTLGEDGFIWWRLVERGYWVRSDVVEESGDCGQLPIIE